MQTILQELNAALAQEDLFLAWKDELQLRKQLRAIPAAAAGLVIENRDDFDFLRRSLYYSDQRLIFLELVYHNRDSLTVLDCLSGTAANLVPEYLAFITDKIRASSPPAQDLKFLINLYKEEFRTDFVTLISAMNKTLCTYLATRTSNSNLRELLQNRLTTLTDADEIEPPGHIDPPTPSNSYPTLYGDKIMLMTAAAEALQNSQDLMAHGPLKSETIEYLLQGAEMLFRSGLITDCLALVADLVKQTDAEVFHLLLEPAAPFHKPVNQLIRKALPFYCLLAEPTDPHHYALELYRSLFPGFSPDPASLIYLDINAIVMTTLQGQRQYGHFELAQKAAKLQDLRPDDPLAVALQPQKPGPIQTDLPPLLHVIAERITSLPHEAATVMGFLRLAQREGRIIPDQTETSLLLQYHLRLYHWVLAAPFMNEELRQELGPVANQASRREADQILKMQQKIHAAGDVDHLNAGGKPSGWENHLLNKQLLLSKYMGVF